MACDPPFVRATCEWPIDSACFDDTWSDLDDDVQDRSVQLASATLRRLTGYRVGGCPITVRPCKPGCRGDAINYYAWQGGIYGMIPYINTAGMWVNACGCQSNDCSCGPLCEIALPGPVGRVDEVKIDGAVIDPSEYRVDGTRLVSLAETCPYPTCQDMTLADTEEGTFSVTYLNGYPVDGLGAYAAGVLANEFAKACTGGKCRLPSGVTQITRQGVSMTIASGAFPGGMTGIREVDTYIALWNPNALRQQTQVWSPDLRSPRVVG